MTLADITKRTSEWMRGAGPMHDVVISSRVRLARNLAGMPFLSCCSSQQRQAIVERLKTQILHTNLGKEMFFVDLHTAGELDRELLVERHLISQPHANDENPRGVIISQDETVSLMINEEDHLRMQVLRSGMQLHEAFEEINRIDDLLSEQIAFSFSSQFGFLTACPTNVGTGLRVSVMLHLPALKLTGEIEKVVHAARDMRLAVRGLYGEGTNATGDIFQISNQTTLGLTEEQIIDEFLHIVVPEILRYERAAREALLSRNSIELDDKIFRSLAVLQAARKISAEETMYLLSMVRLGVNLGRIKHIDLQTTNELFLLASPAHMQKIQDAPINTDKRDIVRATMLRKRLATS